MPFAASIEAGVDAILTAHLVADALDDVPVSRQSGVDRLICATRWASTASIITDALDMEALAEGRGIEGIADAAVRALQAGADFLCLGSNFDEAMTNTVVDRVAVSARRRSAAAHSSRSQPAPHRHVATGLHRRPRSPHRHPTVAAAEIVAERAITVDGQLPDGPFAVVECRPPGSMACFNVSWGIADDRCASAAGRATTITAADPIEPACATAVDAAGDMPILVVVRDAVRPSHGSPR